MPKSVYDETSACNLLRSVRFSRQIPCSSKPRSFKAAGALTATYWGFQCCFSYLLTLQAADDKSDVLMSQLLDCIGKLPHNAHHTHTRTSPPTQLTSHTPSPFAIALDLLISPVGCSSAGLLDYPKAAEAFASSARIQEAAASNGHEMSSSSVIATQIHLGNALAAHGDHAKACDVLARAASLAEQELGTSHVLAGG